MAAQQSPRRARLRLAAIGVTAAAVLAATGALVVNTVTADPGESSKAGSSDPGAPSPSPGASAGRLTPASGRQVPLVDAEKRDSSGVSTGFPRTLGAISAAVRHQEELDLLDDDLARQQLQAISAEPRAVRRGVSDVRRAREHAGLPPSGGPPAGIAITTEVKAVRTRSLVESGDVVEVWMVWDRYAQVKDEATDKQPLRDETSSVIYTWTDGDWKRTAATKWTSRGTYPRAYDPDSAPAWRDGWREVSHG